MPAFSKESRDKLATCHTDLQTLFNEVIKYFDCKIIEGHRSQAAQDAAFAAGKSKLKWPNGNHNAYLSNAVDVAPCPIDLESKNGIARIIHFAGVVIGIAEMLYQTGKMHHGIRWGGDWNSNTILTDQTFNDLVHFELII